MRFSRLSLLLAALALAGCAHQPSASGPSYAGISLLASPGEAGITLVNSGARLYLSPADYLSASSGTVLTSGVADGSSAIALTVNSANSLSTSGAKLQSWQNAGGEQAFVTKDGTIQGSNVNAVGNLKAQSLFSYNATLALVSEAADGAGAIGITLGSDASFITAGAKLVSYKNSTSEKANVDKDGVFNGPGLTCSSSTTHCGTQALTAGSATVTVVSGCHAICTDTTAAAAVKCAVSGATLTITGTSTDSINYFCF